MPEFYPSIGDAIGAAMRHNIRPAHGAEVSGSDTPLQVRHLPHPSADPYSVPGMIARLTETATPHEVAGIFEEVNGPWSGPPAADRNRGCSSRLDPSPPDFENPHDNPIFETWTRLAAATRLLRDVQEEPGVAEDVIAACPAELSDPKYRDEVPSLRTRELLSDVLGSDAIADTKPPASQYLEADGQRAARASSPNAVTQRTAPSAGATSETPATTPPPRSPRTR